MDKVIIIVQIVISILFTLIVLMQNKGVGLTSTFGGGGGGDGSNFYSTKRGAEKVLSRITIILAVLFVANATLYMVAGGQ